MEPREPIIVDEKVFRPFSDDTPTDHDLEVARVELNETPENKIRALQKLKEMLEREVGLTARTDEPYLIKYLRARKFDCDRAFKLILRCYNIRHKHPEAYPLPSSLQKILQAKIVFRSDYKDDKGRSIFFIRPGAWNPDEMAMKDFTAVTNLILEYIIDDPVAQINGLVGVFDASGFSFKHIMVVLRNNGIRLMNSQFQDCFPGRIKKIYCTNCIAIIRTFWRIIYPVIKDKIRKRIHLLGDMTELHKYIDPAILPEEFGGQLPPFDSERAIQEMIDKEESFIYDRKFGYKTSKK